MAELRPQPFSALVGRMFTELDLRDAIFDLPRRRFVTGPGGRDYSVRFHGQRAATPLGPAAGPQSQMAQNLVLSWLAGCRIMELKTVQVDDRLEIPRPCIDMQTVGYNVEWSQELRLQQSLEEYVKGSMLIEMLQGSGVLNGPAEFADTLFDMSVGYDLAGIRTEKVQAFIRGLRDARPLVDQLRKEIPQPWAQLADLPFTSALSETLTLSTFHGCPPHEIEGIIDYLLRELRLNCIVKLNPMLLGPKETRGLLHDALGYDDVRVPDSAFERDTAWDQAVDFVGRLGDTAASLGLGFGVKFTNTLIVANHRDFFPADQEEMYLSGPPLHVLAMHLVRRFRRTFGDRFPISFSAGVDRKNFADCVAGFVPVTVCSDLLKPGGYARGQGYFVDLERRMEAVAAGNVDELILKAYAGAADDLATARLANTEHYVAGLAADPRYHHDQNERVPRKIGRSLVLFDCITCDKCIPVCPNDANFALHVPPGTLPRVRLVRTGSGWERRDDGVLELGEKHQIANFADFCNDCGNCDVFCPEDGGPYAIKPRFFGTLEDWRHFRKLDGFCLVAGEHGRVLHGRLDGIEYGLTQRGAVLELTGPGYRVRRPPAGDDEVLEAARDEIDLAPLEILRVVLTAVSDETRPNPVNARARE